MKTYAPSNPSESCPLDLEILQRRAAETRAMLATQFHVESAFIGVPKVARILGLAPSTVYAYMRAGRFFIPHRMFNTTAMVAVDDLVAWMCDPSVSIPAGRPSVTAAVAEPKPQDMTRKIVDAALRDMGLLTRHKKTSRP